MKLAVQRTHAGRASPGPGKVLESPEDPVWHGILVLEADLPAQGPEVPICREHGCRAMVHCQGEIEGVVDIVSKRLRQLEGPLHRRPAGAHVTDPSMLKEVLNGPVRFRPINPPAFRQYPASPEGHLV